MNLLVAANAINVALFNLPDSGWPSKMELIMLLKQHET